MRATNCDFADFAFPFCVARIGGVFVVVRVHFDLQSGLQFRVLRVLRNCGRHLQVLQKGWDCLQSARNAAGVAVIPLNKTAFSASVGENLCCCVAWGGGRGQTKPTREKCGSSRGLSFWDFGYNVGSHASKPSNGKVIHMATTQNIPPAQASDAAACVQPRKGRTWVPILLGVLGGEIAGYLLWIILPFSFYWLSDKMFFNETSPRKLFDTRTYLVLQFIEVHVLPAIGGLIGVLLSQWRKKTSFLFLLATLVLINGFNILGFYIFRVWHVWH